ncbi:uncharacterized protein LOC141834187 [Curcuma longa]|uniref:uncharacterized protein LOC141834187 n=1 Tax=Curcuma longa TaxID=136217 RepID=UPI003D9F9B38
MDQSTLRIRPTITSSHQKSTSSSSGALGLIFFQLEYTGVGDQAAVRRPVALATTVLTASRLLHLSLSSISNQQSAISNIECLRGEIQLNIPACYIHNLGEMG